MAEGAAAVRASSPVFDRRLRPVGLLCPPGLVRSPSVRRQSTGPNGQRPWPPRWAKATGRRWPFQMQGQLG
jgi:hypothetical protein